MTQGRKGHILVVIQIWMWVQDVCQRLADIAREGIFPHFYNNCLGNVGNVFVEVCALGAPLDLFLS